MSEADDVKQAIEGLEGMLAQELYGSSGGNTADTTIHVGDSTVGNDILISDSSTVDISSGNIVLGPYDSISSGDIIFNDVQGTFGNLTLKVGPWGVVGHDNGDLEVVYETKDKRMEYHFEQEQIVALLEKFASVKVEGKKEDV